MLDPLAQQIGAGGIFALLIIGALVKALPKMISAMRRNDVEKKTNEVSGLRSVDFWKSEMRAAVRDTLADTAAKRHEDLARLMREVLTQELLKRDDRVRQLLREEMGEKFGLVVLNLGRLEQTLEKLQGNIDVTRHDLQNTISSSMVEIYLQERKRRSGGD